MSKKTDLPDTAPRFHEGEWITAAVTFILCLINALALSYHIYSGAPADMEYPVKMAFVVLSGSFALLMGLVPMSLARAHGSALEGGNAQTGILVLVGLFMVVDGALQVHAMHFIITELDAAPPHMGWLIGIAAAFQIAAFFIRGALFAATKEIQDLIDARAQDVKLAGVYARQKLEREAAELGVQFDGRTGDSALIAKISQKKMHIVR